MIMKVFSVYDSKAQMFNVPYFANTTPQAIRSFSDLANDPQTLVCKHPGDFVLYEIGEYDDSNAKMVNYSEHHHLGVASQYKQTGPVAFMQDGRNVTNEAVGKAIPLNGEKGDK